MPARKLAGQLARTLMGLAALAGLLIAAPAVAQSTGDQPTPPTNYNIDGNGVDVVLGGYYFTTTDVAVGGGSDSGLSYGRFTRNLGYDDDVSTALNAITGGTSVAIGALSDRFATASTLSAIGTGATLTSGSGGTKIYTTRDGVIYTFTSGQSSQKFYRAQQRVSSIMWPNGKTVSYEYERPQICFKATTCSGSDPLLLYVSRVVAVASSDGYRLTLRYKLNSFPGANATAQQGADWMTVASVVGSNAGVQYCDLASSGPTYCPPGGSWPSIRYSYAVSGGITTETRTDAENRESRITYDGTMRITDVVRSSAGNAPTRLTYDGNGRVASFTLGFGTASASTWTYGYQDNVPNVGLRTTTITSPPTAANPSGLARVVVSNMDTLKIISDKTGTAGATTYSYDTQTRLEQMVMPEGNRVNYGYDGRSNLTSTTRTNKDASDSIGTAAQYPSDTDCATMSRATCNLPIWTRDALGRQIDYAYTDFGAPLTITLPAPDPAAPTVRPQTRFTYAPQTAWYKNASGTIGAAAQPIQKPTGSSSCSIGTSCSGLATETVIAVGYLAGSASQATNVLPATMTTRAGDNSVSSTTGMTYDAVGNLTEVDGPLATSSDTSYSAYNVARELVGTISPVPDGLGPDGQPLKRRATRIVRDGTTGLITRVEVGTTTGTTLSTFAELQRLESDYDLGTYRKTAERAYGGATLYGLTQYGYDAALRPTCTATRAALATALNVCLQGGNNTIGYDQVAETVYDSAGRVAQTKENGVGTAFYSYTFNSQIETITDANNNTSTYGYDGFDRANSITYPNATTDSILYNKVDRVVSETKRSGATVSNSYDNLNRLKSRSPSGPNTASVTYTYDLFDRLTQATGSGGGAWNNVLSYGYDALSRLTSQTSNTGGAGDHVLTMIYDPAGRRTRLTWGTPTTWGGGFFVGYEYLMTGETTEVRENGAASGIGRLALYGYDDLGRRRSLVRGNGTRTDWTPDGISRLGQLQDDLVGTSRDQTIGLTYNGVSQMKTRTASNDNYAYPNYAPQTQTVVPNALNQMGALNAATPTYDANGNLTNDQRGNAYVYNTDNQLVAKNGAASLAYDSVGRLATIVDAATTRFDYDGQDMIAESDAAGTLMKRFVHGPGIDEPLVWYEGSTRRWLAADERGSITSVADDNGNALTINAYDENGVPAKRNIGRFGYTSQAWLAGVGLAYYKARMYDPSLGRFLQSDPLGYESGANLYAYVLGDPVNQIDPFGLQGGSASCATLYENFGWQYPSGQIDWVSSTKLTFCAPDFTRFSSEDTPQGGGGANASTTALTQSSPGRSPTVCSPIPLSAADRALFSQIMNDRDVVRSMRFAWSSSLASIREKSFFIYQRGTDFYIGKVHTGSATRADVRQFYERFSIQDVAVANYHTQPLDSPTSRFYSVNDISFNRVTGTLGFLQTRQGFTATRGGMCKPK